MKQYKNKTEINTNKKKTRFEAFAEKNKSNWWLKNLHWIVIIVSLIILSLSDVLLSRFHVFNIVGYIGMGLVVGFYLCLLYYFIRSLFKHPDWYDWLPSSIFWLIIAIIVYFAREKVLFGQ